MTTEAQMTTMPETEVPEVPDMQTVFAKMEELQQLVKWFNKQGKTIISKNTKSKRKSRSGTSGGFSAPVAVAPQLATFLQLATTEHIPRTNVTKMITAYIKTNNLQCADNKKNFSCDQALATALGVEVGYTTNWFSMQKILAGLLTKPDTKPDTKEDTPPAPDPPPAEPKKKKLKKGSS